MRNRVLHDALREFALEAAALLTRDLREGAELSFELEEEPGGGAVLYRYRPLTARFIGERWAALRALPACSAAAEALGAGARRYLRVRGAPGADAEPALRAMLERLYEDASDFRFPEARFERVYGEVERTLYHGTVAATVLVPVAGLRLERSRIELADGLALVAGDTVEAPADAVWPRRVEAESGRGEPNALCVLEQALESSAGLPVTEARVRFRELLSGLRLFKRGGVALGPLAWARRDQGPWQPLALGPTGHLRGEPWVLAAAEEDELREFLGLARDGRPLGPVAWALARFEMGAERALDTEALSDYLLALRTLLDGGEPDRASLALRLAALCADEADRRSVQRRVELAFTLERFLIGGGGESYLDEIGSENPRSIVLEVEAHLRALLRDVLCGYLDADLARAADDILLASADPIEIRARDLRRFGRPGAAPGEHDGTRAACVQGGEGGAVADEAETGELGVVRETAGAPPDGGERGWRADAPPSDAVTPSADWACHDDDDASYSAPV